MFITHSYLGTWQGNWEWLRHPLIVLVVGAVITSCIVPLINSRRDRATWLRDTRASTSAQIIAENTAVNKELAALLSALESFWKDTPRDSGHFTEEQREFRRDYARLYAQFDSHAWWWQEAIGHTADSLKFRSSDKTDMWNFFADYKKNLISAIEAIDPIWRSLATFAEQNAFSAETNQRLKDLHTQLDELAEQRGQITAMLVKLFSPK